MSQPHTTGKFLLHITTFVPTDITAIAQASTITHGTDYTSFKLDVTDVDTIVLQGKATGENASATGAVTFTIVGTLDDSLWDTVAVATLAVTMASTAQIVKSDPLDVRGYRFIRCASVANADATYDALVVNLRWGKGIGYLPI